MGDDRDRAGLDPYVNSAPRLQRPPAAPEPTAPEPATKPAGLAEAFVAACADLGIEWAFGLVGGAIAPLCDALGRGSIRCVAARHEGGAAFMALEASHATDRPTLVFTTTGPGLVNALNGVFAARVEGARLLVVSGATSVGHRGRGAVQEMSETVLGSSVELVRPACDLSMTLESPDQLPALVQRLATGFSRRGGFVAHVAFPLAAQRAPAQPLRWVAKPPRRMQMVVDDDDVAAMTRGPLVLWVGHGARHSSAEILALAEHTGALVMCTPHGKGIFPEDHPQFVGVTGFGGHDSVRDMIRTVAPQTVVVLGSRLGEFSSIWDPTLLPGRVLHVDVDDGAFHVGYPTLPITTIVADVGAFCEAMRARLPAAMPPAWRRPARNEAPTLREPGLVRPDRLMHVLQRDVVDATDAIFFAEPGSSFAWATHHLRFATPRYRMSGFWASMGHQVCGAVGASIATGRRSVVLTGDGSLLMNNEISTAAQYGARVTWVVLNDAAYGITEHGMRALGYRPLEARFPRCDFAAIAGGMGAVGFTARNETEIAAALAAALAVDGPSVVDVHIDNDVPSPFIRRIEALRAMGANG